MDILNRLHHSGLRVLLRWGLLLSLALLLGACATPRSLPVGPTPIPTLIPVIEPASPLSEPTASVFTVLSYPARLPSAELGQSLYQTHCASCHGEDGNGLVPGARNFKDLDYMRGNTPASFYSAITEGRGEMPAFRDTLTSDERWDVLFYVWRFSTSAGNLALGHSLYETYCTACHGVDGTGQVLGAADLSDLRLVAERAPRDFYLTVTQGKGSMPAWQGRLSQEERWAVIDYLGTFTYDPSLPEDVGVTPGTTATADEVTCDPAYLSQTNPFAWDDADAIAAGETIYNQSCAVCHAADGTGTLPDIPNLASAQAHSTLLDNSGQYLCTVAEGQKAMPGWKETLTVQEMWQVITFIGTLAK